MSGFVYAIERELGPVKIGRAKDPKTRFSNIQTGSPFELTLERTKHVSDPGAVEQYLHDYFSHYHLRREWFDIPPQERGFEIPESLGGVGGATEPVRDRGRDIHRQWADTLDRLIEAFGPTRHAQATIEEIKREVNRRASEDLREGLEGSNRRSRR